MTEPARNILLAVTGMSPQVVTETLWALATDKDEPFIPDAIHILTTAKGREKAIKGLLVDGHLEALKKDWPQLAKVKFDESCIHVFRRKQEDGGDEIEDITTEEENFCIADTILEHMRQFTKDEHCRALHVSLAGGYKQMSFYMGYIFSLLPARKTLSLMCWLTTHLIILAPIFISYQKSTAPSRLSATKMESQQRKKILKKRSSPSSPPLSCGCRRFHRKIKKAC